MGVLKRMKMSKKCQCALKAIFELASRDIDEPAKIQDIAETQGSPQRLLEAILNELKHGGFSSPDGNKKSKKTTIYLGNNAFEQLLQEVNKTMSEVWNSKTFADLVEFERNSNAAGIPNYAI